MLPSPYSPYGTQTFLISVAWRRNSSPLPVPETAQVRTGAEQAHEDEKDIGPGPFERYWGVYSLTGAPKYRLIW